VDNLSSHLALVLSSYMALFESLNLLMPLFPCQLSGQVDSTLFTDYCVVHTTSLPSCTMLTDGGNVLYLLFVEGLCIWFSLLGAAMLSREASMMT
jgi:hypothetical protein